LAALSERLAAQFPRSNQWGESLRNGLSDLRFTDVSRVPFPFASAMRERFNVCSVVTASSGPHLKSLDGSWTLDVSGSYGVNVAGYDRYKAWIEQGWEHVRDLGPVLGPLHPIVSANIAALKTISGLEEVSFHMSGTEAVMAAARLTRFNTRRRLIVCFAGAYHGWWDGVQPGLGSERSIEDCLTLKEMHPASLAAIRLRAHEIAAVFVNPVQSFHPNTPPPNDAVMLDSSARSANDAGTGYAGWLQQLRTVCSDAGVPLVFDEVYTGFRLASGGAQEYFGVKADMVVYGKTLGGGLPVGVVCGRASLMRRFDPRRPMRMAYVVGTFSAHPAVMGAMYEFLTWVVQPHVADLYHTSNEKCARWIASTNDALAEARLPLRLAGLGTVWTVLYTEPSRFNWLFQYYLRSEGITLSWVGTGRCLCSFDMAEQDYADLQRRLLNAAHTARSDGWWLSATEFPSRAHQIRRHLIGDMMHSIVKVPAPLQSLFRAVMERKHDDHHASHNDAANQLLHLISSATFLLCYILIFRSVTIAMWLGVPALLVRQFGHSVLEPDSHDAEKTLLGYTTRNKSLILVSYLILPIVDVARVGVWSADGFLSVAPVIAGHWFWMTMLVVLGRVAFLTVTKGPGLAMIWLMKLVTDPLTDLIAYRPWRSERSAA
jgi:glutamate-1-semialdehyde 2,1-aminomutase